MVTIDLGATYAGAFVEFTALNPQGYNDGFQQSTVYSQILSATGTVSVTGLEEGQQYRVMVCKSDGTSCLLATINVTGATQDISATLAAYPVASGSGATVTSASTTLSSANLLALETTPVTLVTAPGASKVIVPLAVTLQYRFVTTAYTIEDPDNAFALVYAGSTTAFMIAAATGLVDQTANAYSAMTAEGVSEAQTAVANKALQMSLQGTDADLTLGAGNVVVTVYYQTLTLS